MTEEEINKLPKWAQRQVRTLQMRLNEAEQEIERKKNNTPSNTFSEYAMEREFLRDNTSIVFKLPLGSITARIDNEAVFIIADPLQGFSIQPHSGNSCKLKLFKERP